MNIFKDKLSKHQFGDAVIFYYVYILLFCYNNLLIAER